MMSDFEQVELDTENAEVRMTRSDYAQVIFINVAETYTMDSDVDVRYTVTRYHSPSKRDWVGLYKVGWTSSKDNLYYHWAILPPGYQQGQDYEAKLTFAGSVLPKEDGEFYQFCYVTSSGHVRGASTPFQFRHRVSEEFVEVMDSDDDIMIIRSKTSALEEELQAVQDEKEDILKQKCRVEKEMESFLSKLMEIERSVASEQKEKEALRVDLQATQDKVASLHCEVKEKTACYETLNTQYRIAKEENIHLEAELKMLVNKSNKLVAELKAMHNQVDQLSGKNKCLTDEKDLYQAHFNATSDTLQHHKCNAESQRQQHERAEDELKSVRYLLCEEQQKSQAMQNLSARHSATILDDKKCITDQRLHLQALTEQMEALTECKLTLGQQVDELMDARDKAAAEQSKNEHIRSQQMDRIQSLEDEGNISKTNIQRLMQEIKALQEQKYADLDWLKEEKAALDEELELLRSEVEPLRTQLEQLTDINKAQEEACDDDKKHIDRQNVQITTLEQEIGDLNIDVDSLQQDVEELTACNHKLYQQVDKLMESNQKMASDREAHLSEAFDVKEQLKVFMQKTQNSSEAEMKCLQEKLYQKTEENVILNDTVNHCKQKQGSMFALQMAHEELKKRLSKAEHQKTVSDKEAEEVHKSKALRAVREREMTREIEDLKERLLMGQDAFKDKCIECQQLNQLLKKTQRMAVHSRDSSVSAEPSMATKTTETARKSENEQTTQTSKSDNERTTQTCKAESEGTTQTSQVEKKDSEQMTNDDTVDLSNDEIQMQLAELGQELENRCAKKLKYKRLYQEEKEKGSYVQKHYHEQIEKKERELEEFRRQMRQQADEHEQYVRRMDEVQKVNMKQKIRISSLENMLAQKPQIRQAPRIPARTSRVAESGSGARHATLCYGNTEAAKHILEKVNAMASERSTQKEGSVTELEQAAEGYCYYVGEPLTDRHDAVRALTEGSLIELKLAAKGCYYVDQPLTDRHDAVRALMDRHDAVRAEFDPFSTSDSEAEPGCEVEVTNHKAGVLSQTEGTVVVGEPNEPTVVRRKQHRVALVEPILFSEPTPVITRPPSAHIITKKFKKADQGSTEYCGNTETERVSVIPEAPVDATIDRDAHSDVTGASVIDRQIAPTEQDVDEYFDAPVEPVQGPVCPSCPVCNLVFPPNTDETILNAHANTHFNSLGDSNAEVAVEAPSKKCPMCAEVYPDDAANQQPFEQHVQGHFEGNSFV